MKTKLFVMIISLSMIVVYSCKKDKKKGCMNGNSLVYDPSAEEDDGTCTYASGSYLMSEDCGSIDNYTLSILGDGSAITFNNFGNQFDNISATRSGLSIIIYGKSNIPDRTGKVWDFMGGSGSISADGKHLILSDYSFSDILYGNQVGTINCNATGSK